MSEHYDVIVIGTGAGGATIAHRLAPSGKRILISERGDFLAREKENWVSSAVWGERRYRFGRVSANALRVGDRIAERLGGGTSR
ncbi:MAG: NAD(P)-binding protein [Acidimicrobiales bacterium]